MRATIVAALGLSLLATLPGRAETIIDEWSKVPPPPAPQLKPAKIEGATTALLVLDLQTSNCNAERRPRCVASLPRMEKLLADARGHGLTVIFSTGPNGDPKTIHKEVAPKPGEPVVAANADKFIGTDLDKLLKDKGIKTVIVVGTAAQGANLYTASAAAMRGYQVVVPVEGVTAEDAYREQVAVWLLANAPTISRNVTLTRIDMISY